MLVLTMMLAGLFLATLQERRDYILYDKKYMSEDEFLDVSELPIMVQEEQVTKVRRTLQERSQKTTRHKLRPLMSRFKIIKRFGHNGLVYYDHKLDRKVSVFLTKEYMGASDTLLINWLITESIKGGY